MNWKLLLDEDVYPRLSQALQQRDINATHIQEMGRKGLSD
jgi:predicted nuclease of predicted toxin-antitoxin system